jgi:hypothetical protein
VNEGTTNVLRSMHAKLMTLQGQTGKNSGYPYFDGKLKEYPKFRRRWHTFQDLYHKATPQRKLVNLFRENCLEKKVADWLRCEETMAGCWRVLDPFYSRPTQYAQDLMSEITATKKIQHSEYERLFEYYALLRGNITDARKANLMEALLTQANIALMEHPLPAREIEEWRSHQARYAPRYHADAFVEFVDDREEWALKNVAYSTAPSSHNSSSDNQKGRKSYEKREAKVMAVKVVAKGKPDFPPPKRWSPDHPWGRPCIVDECREEHAPPLCALFKGKTPDERLAVVRCRELCILCFRHLDTKRCWSLGKVDNCNVRGCGRAHNYLLHDVLQNEEVLMVSALPGRVSEPESVLRCRQMVANENEGQCFRLNVLYDWGATVSMISEEAVEVMGLSIARQAKRIIKGLGGATTVSKGTCTLSLVARNGDRKTVTAWEVGEVASLPGGQPPEDVDEQFPGLRYLSEPNCLIQRAGPIHVLLGMDHAHLMPEHVAESTDLSSQLRLMSSMFGGRHILVGEGAPRLSWYDAMEADERYEAAANRRRKREECRKMAQEARQTALQHTHKLPRRLWDDEKEKSHPPMRRRPQGDEECGPSCRERRTLWKEELSSLSTLVGTVATLLAVITPSEGAEPGGVTGWHPRWIGEPGMEGILVMDYWMVLPIIMMVVTGLIMRIQRHLGGVWKPGDDGPILARVRGANLPIDGGGTSSKD